MKIHEKYTHFKYIADIYLNCMIMHASALYWLKMFIKLGKSVNSSEASVAELYSSAVMPIVSTVFSPKSMITCVACCSIRLCRLNRRMKGSPTHPLP